MFTTFDNDGGYPAVSLVLMVGAAPTPFPIGDPIRSATRSPSPDGPCGLVPQEVNILKYLNNQHEYPIK